MIGGFYRTWTDRKENSEESQLIRANEFRRQSDLAASSPNSDIIILGDANLDSNKWKQDKFTHAKVARVFFDIIEQNGLQVLDV